MAWFRVDDGSAHHTKVMAAGNEAWGAICRAGAASSKEGTDGFVKQVLADSIAKPRVWQRAIDAGLLHKVDGGYQIHDFLDWNPSAVEVEQQRAELAEKRRAAGLAGAAKRWDGHQKKQRVANSKPDGKPMALAIDTQMANGCPSPDPSRPMEERENDPTDRAEPPVAVLTNPERKPRKTSRVNGKQQTILPKPPIGLAWKNWRDMYETSRRDYGRYVENGDCKGAMVNIAQGALDEATAEARDRGDPAQDLDKLLTEVLRHWFGCYLRDDGHHDYLATARHPVRFLLKSLSEYGLPRGWGQASKASAVAAMARIGAVPDA